MRLNDNSQEVISIFNFPVFILMWLRSYSGLPGGSDGEESACNVRDTGLIPGSGRSPGEGHGNPLQYPCLENPMDTGAWRATVHGVTESQTPLKRLLSAHIHLGRLLIFFGEMSIQVLCPSVINIRFFLVFCC